MIKSFKDDDAKRLWDTGKARHLPSSIRKTTLKKLLILHWARTLRDLAVPVGNHLEALTEDRKGQQSIRINDQYRLCFVWREGDAFEVEIVDYH